MLVPCQTAEVDPTALIGPNVVIGPGCKIGAGVRLQRCVIMANANVKEHAWVMSSIIGWNSSVGRWARVENITVLGDDVTIKDELLINGASVLPHKSVRPACPASGVYGDRPLLTPGRSLLAPSLSLQIASSITEPRIVM
jgi:acyl-[acyl carrier protein]--UDP-N-acetylglucosamine O-acyltransferase